MFGKSKYADINSALNKKFNDKKVLIAQHRGAHGGNIPQNTIIAFKTSLMSGADMFEMDVSRSADGQLYCFHDTTEPLNLKIDKNIQTLTSDEIDKLQLYNSIGEPSLYRVQKMEDAVAYFSHGELYNIDRSWYKLDDTFALLNKYPYARRQAVLKAPVKREILDRFQAEPVKYMFMPIVYDLTDIETVKSYTDINAVGFEMIVKDESSPLYQDALIDSLHNEGYFLWINAITLSSLEKHVLCAKHGDNESLECGFDKGWGVLIKKGYDVIQTDWPQFLSRYRDSFFSIE